MSIDPAKRVHVIGWSCLMILALGLTIPAVVGPFQMGDDFVFHVGNWIDVLNHWKQGVAFPSWNVMQAFGLGEPTHLFYPPLSFYLGAFLTWLSGPAYAPVIFLGLCIVIAGMTMYSFASEYLSPEQGWLAAILFALNPYLLLDIIVRSAF